MEKMKLMTLFHKIKISFNFSNEQKSKAFKKALILIMIIIEVVASCVVKTLRLINT